MSDEGAALTTEAGAAPTTAAERAALLELEDALAFRATARTLQEIGDRIGLSREQVRLIEKRAMRKLWLRVDRKAWQQTSFQSSYRADSIAIVSGRRA